MTDASHLKATLQDRYPLPDWVVDSEFKRELTLTVASAIAGEVKRWPRLHGPKAQLDHAARVTQAVCDALEPRLAWLRDYITDGFSYPGDVLVSYISQLALTRPGEAPDADRYRELLRTYERYLIHQAHPFQKKTCSDPGAAELAAPVFHERAVKVIGLALIGISYVVMQDT